MKIIKYFVFLLLVLFACSLTSKPVTVFMVGDSTMADKPIRALPENGWGMQLQNFMNNNAIVKNYAANGRSSKSFINEGRWDSVYSKISTGDFVIIQFGHNDEKFKDSNRYTIPKTTYKQYLKKYITDTRDKGGIPILCTSIVRLKYNQKGKLENTHADYPQAMREVAKEMNVELVDLQKLTESKLNKIGQEKATNLYLVFGKNEYVNFPEGKNDSTHLRVEGAKLVAKLFTDNAKKQHLSIRKYIK